MSRILSEMQETAEDLYEAGVMDLFTMRRIEELCLSQPKPMDGEAIKALRFTHKISQSVLAKYLNVKTVTVKKWEMGTNSPGGPSLKLLNLIQEKGLKPLQF